MEKYIFENIPCWLLDLVILSFFIGLISLMIVKLHTKMALVMITLSVIVFYYLLDHISLIYWENLKIAVLSEENRHLIKSYSPAKEQRINIFSAFLAFLLWFIALKILFFKSKITANSK
jgi:hypothetical protein